MGCNVKSQLDLFGYLWSCLRALGKVMQIVSGRNVCLCSLSQSRVGPIKTRFPVGVLSLSKELFERDVKTYHDRCFCSIVLDLLEKPRKK